MMKKDLICNYIMMQRSGSSWIMANYFLNKKMTASIIRDQNKSYWSDTSGLKFDCDYWSLIITEITIFRLDWFISWKWRCLKWTIELKLDLLLKSKGLFKHLEFNKNQKDWPLKVEMFLKVEIILNWSKKCFKFRLITEH